MAGRRRGGILKSMSNMTVKEFDRLSRRDFENGAVLDSIHAALKERERLEEEHARLQRTVKFMEESYLKAHGGNWGDCKYQLELAALRKLARAVVDEARWSGGVGGSYGGIGAVSMGALSEAVESKICERCDGSGLADGARIDDAIPQDARCPMCKGTGESLP